VAAKLPDGSVHLESRVLRIEQQPDGSWLVSIAGDRPCRERFDAIVLAAPAKAAGQLLADVDPELSEQVRDIDHSGCSIVSLAYRRSQIAHRMDGFGFVVPAAEKRSIISGSFSSVKYPGRAPDGWVLMRVFIGGALQADLVDLPDEQLTNIAKRELAELLRIQGEPASTRIARLPDTMPQYYVGHRDRVAVIRQRVASHKGLFLTGNAYGGVGIPFCVHGGEKTAEQVIDYFGAHRDNSRLGVVS
jgi:oxygen-dependent protoporphyrinogen oxidase